MSVSIIWSLTNGGDAIGAVVDLGNSPNGANSGDQEIFVRHDAVNEITSVGLFMRAYSGPYGGGATAIADEAELISWGDDSTAAGFGGFQANLLATTAYPSSAWPVYSSKSPTGGFVHRTGVGDSEGNAFTLPTTTGADIAGELQAGSSPNVRFKVRCQIPADEDTAGVRQWDHVLAFSFTS